MCDPINCPHFPLQRTLIWAEGSHKIWFLWAFETYPYQSRTQILGLAGVLGPTLFSDDTKLAGSAGLSVLSSFLLGSEGIVPGCWTTLIYYGLLEIIICLHSLKWSWSCSVSFVFWWAPETCGSSPKLFPFSSFFTCMVFAYAAASPLRYQQSGVLLLFSSLHANTQCLIDLIDTRKDFFTIFSRSQQTIDRNSDFVCSGAHDIGEAENHLSENNQHWDWMKGEGFFCLGRTLTTQSSSNCYTAVWFGIFSSTDLQYAWIN